MAQPQPDLRKSASTSLLFDVVIDGMPGFVWLANAQGKVEHVNQAWLDYTGLTLAQSVGDGWIQAVHPEDIMRARAIGMKVRERPPGQREGIIRYRRSDGCYRWHLVRANPAARDDASWIGCAVDIHAQAKAQERDRAQLRLLELVTSGASLDTILQELSCLAEHQLAGCRSTIMMLDDTGTHFSSYVAAFLPEHMRSLLTGLKIGPGVGSCGTAAFERRDVISANIFTDPLWQNWRDIFGPLGVKSCWSRPVYGSDGKVLAVFGFYFLEARAPSEDELESLDHLLHIASLAIEKARIAQSLRESEEHHRHTVEHNPQIPWTADPEGRILSVSSRWTQATGLTVEDALGSGWFKALHPDDVKRTASYWAQKLRTGEDADLKYRIRLQDGSYRWVRVRASARRDEAGRIIRWYGAAEDVHDLELATERLRLQAHQDGLTHLLNWRGLEEQLRNRLVQSHADAPHLSLLLVDIEGFRHINQRFGHETGDAVLRLFARYLETCAEESDVIARIAGDEFVILTQSVSEAGQLEKHVRKLASCLSRQLERNAKTRNRQINIGAALAEPGDTADELLKRANLALHAAKDDPHCRTRLYTPLIRRLVDEKGEQIDLARQALQARWIVPYYQPMVELATGKVAGAEALLRIAHPRQGVLGPASVWAALDAPKISRSINDRMFCLVLADLKRWRPWPREAGTISINLSTEMLLHKTLARSILQKLDRHRIAPWQLTVEITERVLIDDLAMSTKQALQDLQAEGVRISLDDFGTGYASLTHLQTLPVNEIKIDRSFVQDLAADGPNAAIVRSMINLGQNMGVDVVAEGVETAMQARLLDRWGCRYAQGYHYFKPLCALDVATVWEHDIQPEAASRAREMPAAE